jgi:spermidine synthase
MRIASAPALLYHCASEGNMRASSTLRAAFVLIGFTAVIAQIVLMRELLVAFYGNEISLGIILANWLLWTALGSGVVGRLGGRIQNPRRLMAGLQVVVGIAFPAAILVVSASRNFFHPTPGEILGPGPMFLTSLAGLSIFCLASGMLFAAGSRACAREAGAPAVEASSSVYLLEAVGSGIGGLLASLLLIRYLDAFQIALAVSLLNLLAAAILAVATPRLRRIAIGALLAVFAFAVIPVLSKRLETISRAWLWRGFHVVATHNSIYGNLAVVQTEGTRSLFENGLAVFTVPDPAAAEEAVHYALLQHPSPRSLLLIGGGVNGSLAQALQYTSLERVDYVELDPAVFDLAAQYFPAQWQAIRSDPRVRLHNMDGRLFLKNTPETFDVIILNLPDPETALLNRFYTAEFFREAAARLSPGGVFSFQLRSSEDYISPELADFLRCIRKTLAEVFPEVTALPGETVHFFAARRAGILARTPQELVARLQARHLHTSYVREYYIPFRMMPDRMKDFQAQTQPRASTPVNLDFAPIAYYFDTALWSGRFDLTFRRLLVALARVRFRPLAVLAGLFLLVLAGGLGAWPNRNRRLRSSAGFCIAATGFTMIGLEIMLLLGFQAVYGYVYHQLAILIAAFMAGMAAGSGWAIRRRAGSSAGQSRPKDALLLAVLQALVAVSPLLLYVVFTWVEPMTTVQASFVVSQIVFPALAVLCGLLGGYQFPVASRVFFAGNESPSRGYGTLYALDLAGACVGAVALSVYWIPVFGFLKTASLIAVVNLAPTLLAAGSVWAQRAHSD